MLTDAVSTNYLVIRRTLPARLCISAFMIPRVRLIRRRLHFLALCSMLLLSGLYPHGDNSLGYSTGTRHLYNIASHVLCVWFCPPAEAAYYHYVLNNPPIYTIHSLCPSLPAITPIKKTHPTPANSPMNPKRQHHQPTPQNTPARCIIS